MEEINREIDELFSDLQEGSPPQIHDPTFDHIPTTPITPDHSPSPSPSPPPSPNPKPAPEPAASKQPQPQPSVPTTSVSGPSVQNQPDTHPATTLIQPTQLEIPPTSAGQQPNNPSLENLTLTGTQVKKQAEQ